MTPIDPEIGASSSKNLPSRFWCFYVRWSVGALKQAGPVAVKEKPTTGLAHHGGHRGGTGEGGTVVPSCRRMRCGPRRPPAAELVVELPVVDITATVPAVAPVQVIR